MRRVPGNIVCYVSLLRQTVKLMEASSKSSLPSRKMRRVQGPKERTPHSPRWLPWANWAEAFAPPSAPRCVPRCCRQGPSGRQEITTGPQACRSLRWASAACSRTSALGEEPFVCFKSKKHNLFLYWELYWSSVFRFVDGIEAENPCGSSQKFEFSPNGTQTFMPSSVSATPG